MTTNVNALKYGAIAGLGVKQLQVPCDEAVSSVKAGDLVYLDTSAHLAKPCALDANAATLLGVAAQPSAVSSQLDLSSAPKLEQIIVQCQGVFAMKSTASETYNWGAVLYVGADAQTVTTVVGTNAVGMYVGKSGIVGAAGLKVDVLINGKY